VETLDDLNVRGEILEGRSGIWGRTGQLAFFDAAVRQSVSYFGAYLNVCPPMGLFQLVDTDPLGQTKASCLMAERRGPVRMTAVRAALVRRLAENFGCDRYHLYTGHPLLRRTASLCVNND
jgi:lipoyl(octanoyl) transferase